MALSARTRSLLTWLPATALVVVIGLVVLATFAVQGSWWAEEDPAASADQKASDGSSMLTDAGFDYVNVEGVFRMRIGDGAQSAQQLGMADDAEKAAELRRPVRAIIAGGDDVYVVDDIGTVEAATRDGQLAAITLAFDQPSTWSDAVARVSGLAPTYGWDQSRIDGLEEELAAFNRTGSTEPFTAVVGPSTGGAQVTANLIFDPAGGLTALSLTFQPGA